MLFRSVKIIRRARAAYDRFEMVEDDEQAHIDHKNRQIVNDS